MKNYKELSDAELLEILDNGNSIDFVSLKSEFKKDSVLKERILSIRNENNKKRKDIQMDILSILEVGYDINNDESRKLEILECINIVKNRIKSIK